MILMAYSHGLRASEVIQITAADVQDGVLTVRRLKGSNRTDQPLIEHPDSLRNERLGLLAFVRKSKGNQRLFPITRQRFWQIVQEHGRTAGIPRVKCHPHALKHTIGRELHKKIGASETQVHMGHKSGASTLMYGKTDPDEVAASVQRALKS